MRTGRSSPGARPRALVIGRLRSLAEPAYSRRARVVGERCSGLHGALAEVCERLPETPCPRLADARDLRVREPGPESVRTQQHDVTGLQRTPGAQAHLGEHRIAADTALDEVAHRMRRGLRLGDASRAQQQLDVAVVA